MPLLLDESINESSSGLFILAASWCCCCFACRLELISFALLSFLSLVNIASDLDMLLTLCRCPFCCFRKATRARGGCFRLAMTISCFFSSCLRTDTVYVPVVSVALVKVCD